MPKEVLPAGEDNEFERPTANIEWYGAAGGESPDYEVWQEDGISAKDEVIVERFGLDGKEDVPRIMDKLKSLAAEKFRLASLLSAVRCIDGRGEGKKPGKDAPIGPQVPGGTPVMALCYMLASGQRGKNIEEDLAKYEALIADLPFPPGAHTDEKNHGSEEKTGCGAIDKMLEILELMCDRKQMFGYLKAVMGEALSDDELKEAIEHVVTQAEELLTDHRDNYFMKDQKKGFFGFGRRVIKKIQDVGSRHRIHTVEDLAGDHQELFVLINMLDGYTFDRDDFTAESKEMLASEGLKGEAQAFSYDFWHVARRANALFDKNEEAKRTMMVSNAMYAVATAMALTDGSLQLGVIRG